MNKQSKMNEIIDIQWNSSVSTSSSGNTKYHQEKKNDDLTRTDLIFSATHSKTTVVYFLEIAEYLDKGMETLFIH